MSGELFLYSALTVVVVALFAYIAMLHLRIHRLQKEAKRLAEMIEGGKKPG